MERWLTRARKRTDSRVTEKEALAATERKTAAQRDQSDAKVTFLRKKIAEQNRETNTAKVSSELKWKHAETLRRPLRRLQVCLSRCDGWEISIKGVLDSEKQLENLCDLAGQGLRLPQVDALERDIVSRLTRHDNHEAALS